MLDQCRQLRAERACTRTTFPWRFRVAQFPQSDQAEVVLRLGNAPATLLWCLGMLYLEVPGSELCTSSCIILGS